MAKHKLAGIGDTLTSPLFIGGAVVGAVLVNYWMKQKVDKVADAAATAANAAADASAAAAGTTVAGLGYYYGRR
jgi:hypothetical protein